MIRRFVSKHNKYTHLEASKLIREGLNAKISEQIGLLPKEQIIKNQSILLERLLKYKQKCHHIILDGHLLINNNQELVKIPLDVVKDIAPQNMILVTGNVQDIISHRTNDQYKHRPSQTVNEIEQIQNYLKHVAISYCKEKNGSVPDFLDIGIKIKEINNVSSINLFVPFQLEKCDICDLGETISNNQNLLTAIFNERNGVDRQPNKSLVKITLFKESCQSVNESFLIFNADEINDIITSPHQQGNQKNPKTIGTIIKIKTNNINIDSEINIPVYFRIRIKFLSSKILDKILHEDKQKDFWLQSSIAHEDKQKDFWLQSSIAKKQFIDFRFNEKRNLPKTIQNEYAGKFLHITKIHFFLIREFADELVISDPKLSGYRVLEKDIWLEYVNVHRNKKSQDNFTLSIQFSFQVSSKRKIFNFLIITLIIGAIGGVGGNYLTGIAGNLWNKLFNKNGNGVEKININEPKSIIPPIETK